MLLSLGPRGLGGLFDLTSAVCASSPDECPPAAYGLLAAPVPEFLDGDGVRDPPPGGRAGGLGNAGEASDLLS
jgi:hypothetical protein